MGVSNKAIAPDLLTNYEREPKGIPIGRAPTVNLRNNHTQYIFTWFVPIHFVLYTAADCEQVRAKLRDINHVLDGRKEANVRHATKSPTQRRMVIIDS